MDSTKIMKSTTRLFILFSALMASFTGDGGGSSGVARGQEDWMQCPLICKCKWVSGKKTAECIKQNLTEIPKGLSSEIQNLDLNSNRITSVQQHAFNEVKLVNLHKLVLRDCGIETIHIGAFHGLKIVIEIDLSGNNIKTLVPGTFDETQRLRVLLLNQNRLRFLENGLFHDLVYLQKVALSENLLESIKPRAFRNLTNLHSLTLDGNNLSNLSVHCFETLPKLGSLELHNNPWKCDCHLKNFREWTIQRKLYTKPTTCQAPSNLAGKMWDEIDSDAFACKPKIVSIGPALRTEIDSGDVTFWCRATGVPRPQLSWVYRSKSLNNLTRRQNGEKGYLLTSSNEWLNLTIPDVSLSDKGDYVCVATSQGGQAEKNISLAVIGNTMGGKDGLISLPLALGLGVTTLLSILITITLCLCCCRRRRTNHDEKSVEAASMEHHGLGEQEKSLITAINPVVKPPRRYEAPSVTSHGTEMTELNRTLLDNESVFADGINGGGSVIVGGGGVDGGRGGGEGGDDDREERVSPELDGSLIGTLTRGSTASTTGVVGYRQYPPDLLAFSGGRGASPTSQASTAPDNTRLPIQHPTTTSFSYNSPSGQYPAAFKTLPRSVTPYNGMTPTSSYLAPVLPRHGYVTIPRRPRAPSWSSGPPPSSPTSTSDYLEPVYDNLGKRTTADGSSKESGLSLNKSPEPIPSIRSRPLPGTPTSLYGTIQRSTPNIPSSSPLDRSAPEGAPEWPSKLNDESMDSILSHHPQQQVASNTLGRKIPPRPPPKPKKKSANGPLYEDEGEDGTEV